MNSTNDEKARAVQLDGTTTDKCFVCGASVGERCFCRICRKEGEGPIMLCCPDCTIQYLDSAQSPLDINEQELRAYENSVHLFVGKDKPWL